MEKKTAAARKTGAPQTVKKKKPAAGRKKGKGQGRAGRVVFGVLVTLAALMVAFFVYVKVQGEISLPENAVGSLLSPVQSVVSSATRRAQDWLRDLADMNRLRSDYEALEVEMIRLEYQISQMQEEMQENDRLKALLEAQDRYEELEPIYAKVIAKEAGGWFDMFSINKGTLDGVAKGMTVIGEGGLVGRVSEAGLNYAKVICIVNGDSSVACLIERTRDNGVMKGQLGTASDDDTCRMYYVKSVNDIVPGDSVITSGLDGIYPKGIVVGTVTEVSRQSDTSNQYLSIKPAADFLHIEEVLVLQRVIETAGDKLPVLPEATTRAQPTEPPEATPTPMPGEEPEGSTQPDYWTMPTATPDPNAPREPVRLHEFPEDIWVNS